jgi:hypothetical protein
MVGLARNISLGDFGVSNSTSCLSGSQSLLGVLVSDISVARILKMVEHNLATRIRNLIHIKKGESTTDPTDTPRGLSDISPIQAAIMAAEIYDNNHPVKTLRFAVNDDLKHLTRLLLGSEGRQGPLKIIPRGQ